MKKVKITKVPNMAWGGMVFNQVAPNALPYQTDEDMMRYSNILQPVDREDANLEAEKDEEVVLPNYKGMSAKFTVGGKRHSEGGTPLNLPDDSFVFSDTKAMKIKDPNILKAFGKAPKKGGYTPAELAKGYDINKYRKVLDDPMSDSIQKKTAEEMIGNYNVLLGKLALAQESKKGFPQGVPFIAEPYMMVNKVSPEDILPMPEEQSMQTLQQPVQVAKYGGGKKVRIKQLPQAQAGFQAPWQKTLDMINPQSYPINPATGKAEFKPQSQSADPNAGQIIPPGSHISETERNKALDFLKPKSGMEAFAKRQVAKDLIGDVFGNENEDDPMLVYRTMEDTMTGIPTNKGTFNPLDNNNLPYKNDYAISDPFTYSIKYGGSLPKAQFGNLEGNFIDNSLLPASAFDSSGNPTDEFVPVITPSDLLNKTNTDSNSSLTKTKENAAKPSDKSKSGDILEFNQPFWNEYSSLGQSGAFVYDVPGINFKDFKERQRKATQGARKDKNIYGDLDWNKGDLINDFKRRHQWYLKDHPDFDPTDINDVKDFQTQYCSRATAFGMKNCYFLEAGKSGTGFDGKFGEHTWSAPGFNTPAEQPVPEIEDKQKTKQEDIKSVGLQQPSVYDPFEYYPQDVLNLMTAMGTKIPDPKTFYSNLAWQAYSPAYVKEDYSPIMESANIATQGIGAYGSRQSADASYSGIQGKAARQAADHNLQVANLNVGIYNDAEKFNAQTREKNYMYNQMQKQQNFDTEQAYAADRIKAKNEKRANVAALYNQMLTNAVDTYNLNIMNPNFKVLPGTGGRIALMNTDFLKPNKDALTSARLKEYRALLAEGLTHDQAMDVMGRQTGKASYPQQQQYPYSNPYDYMTGLNYYEG